MVPTPRMARATAEMTRTFLFMRGAPLATWKACVSAAIRAQRAIKFLVGTYELRGRRESVRLGDSPEHQLDFSEHFPDRASRLLHATEHQAHFRVFHDPFLEVGLEAGVEAFQVLVGSTHGAKLAGDPLEEVLRGPTPVQLDVGQMRRGNTDTERELAKGRACFRSQATNLAAQGHTLSFHVRNVSIH